MLENYTPPSTQISGAFIEGPVSGVSGRYGIYGAAGGIIVLLVWVYYSAQIFLLGAEFTKVWAGHYGSQRKKS